MTENKSPPQALSPEELAAFARHRESPLFQADLALANRILDRIGADPDSDVATMARRFIRRDEACGRLLSHIASLTAERDRLNKFRREIAEALISTTAQDNILQTIRELRADRDRQGPKRVEEFAILIAEHRAAGKREGLEIAALEVEICGDLAELAAAIRALSWEEPHEQGR